MFKEAVLMSVLDSLCGAIAALSYFDILYKYKFKIKLNFVVS